MVSYVMSHISFSETTKWTLLITVATGFQKRVERHSLRSPDRPKEEKMRIPMFLVNNQSRFLSRLRARYLLSTFQSKIFSLLNVNRW